jgi:hypothetical protein
MSTQIEDERIVEAYEAIRPAEQQHEILQNSRQREIDPWSRVCCRIHSIPVRGGRVKQVGVVMILFEVLGAASEEEHLAIEGDALEAGALGRGLAGVGGELPPVAGL